MANHASQTSTARTFSRSALRMLCRHWPLWIGYSRVTRSKLARYCYGHSNEVHPITLANGIQIEALLTDYNARMLDLFGSPDARIVRLCRTLLNPGDSFLDIGANIGAVGLLCNDCVLPGGRVDMFEPQPQLYERLSAAIESQSLTHIHAYNIALLDRDATMEMAAPAWHTGKASLNTDSNSGQILQVQVKDAGGVLPAILGDRPWAAKIDTEGSDTTIFRIISKFPNLQFCVFEYNDPSDWPRLREHAHAQNLGLVEILPSSWSIKLHQVDSQAPASGVTDLLAIPSAVLKTLPSEFSATTLTQAMRKTR